MALVDYTDSENSDDYSHDERDARSRPPELKRRRSLDEPQKSALPPLPDSFHDLYASRIRVSKQDDPSLHAGRQRQVAHIEGQWPTHVYIEWHPSKAQNSILNDTLHDVEKSLPPSIRLHSLLESDLGTELPLHISLSRTLMLSTEERQPFLKDLQMMIQASGVRPFTVVLNGLRWVPNYESNRWFLVSQVQGNLSNELNKLLRASNGVAEDYGQPSLYVEPGVSTTPISASRSYRPGKSITGSKGTRTRRKSLAYSQPSETLMDASARFHVSFGWTLQKPPEIPSGGIEGRALDVAIRAVKVKVGNGVEMIALDSNIVDPLGIIGA